MIDASANPQTRRPPSLPENYIYTSCYCEENVYLLAQTFVEQLAAREDPEWEVYVVFISNDDKTVALWNQRSSKRPDVGNLVVWDYHVILVLRERIHAASIAEPTLDFYPTNNAGENEEVHHIDKSKSRSRETPGWTSGHGMLDHTVTTEDGETSVKTQTDTSYDDDYNCSQPQWRTTAQLASESPEPIAWVYDLDGCAEVPCPFDDYVRSTFPYIPVLRENAIGGWEVPEELVSLFRVVPAAVYLDNFVSDRSHMLVHPQAILPAAADEDSPEASQQNTANVQLVYSSAPPSYAPLRGKKIPIGSEIRTNLMTSFVSMRGHRRQCQLTRREHLDTEDTRLTEPGIVESEMSRDQGGDVEAGMLVSGDELPNSASLEEEEPEEYGEVMNLESFLEWGGFCDHDSEPKSQ